ncbi:type II secretion system protein [Coraliomargarita sp. W4R53]
MKVTVAEQNSLKLGLPPSPSGRKSWSPLGGTPTPESRAHYSRRSRAAFTLVEVLIAVAIFAMTSSVLMSAFVNALLARESAANYDLLNADIRAVRMQLLLEPNLEDAEDGDDYETLHCGDASWEAQIVPTNVVDLFLVQFSIRFSAPPEDLPGEYSETLYLLRPTWSETDERSELLQDKREALEDTRGDFNF